MSSGDSAQRSRHSLVITPEQSPGRRRGSFLNLHIPETNWKGSLSHLHLPTFTITTADGEQQSLASKFTFGLVRRHSHNTLHRTESMVSLCFRSLTGYINDDNLRGLQSFLESRQVQVDDKDENGTTALMVAAGKGRLSIVRELLAHGADPNIEDNDSWTALLCAAKEGHTDIVLQLLDHNAAIDHRDIGGWSALMWATYKGRLDTALVLVERGADVNAHGNFHISSLLWAAGRGYTEIVECLLQHNAKVNVGDKYGTTALVWASRKGYTEIVDLLLKAGANVDTAGMYSWTALLVATYGNHVDVVNLLLEHKPNVNALDKDGCSPLTIACKEGFYEIATSLMAAGAYINIQDRSSDTNLIHAVKGGHRGVVEVLLKKYADVDILGKDRKTAIYVAVEKGNVNIAKLLLTCNPDLELATKDGDTPLLKAVRSRNAEIVQLLIDKKAKVSATDKKGDTALHIAMRARSKAIVEILLRNPKNSQLLYRPNRAGETPYNIDMNHQKTILGQIFGARRLNTNEDNENMLGYDLYSSALADILSEPSLSMPIMVGLYAKWGSGKSFLLNKLRDEMKNFAREWVDPVFQFSTLLFLVLMHISIILATIFGLSFQSWLIGLCVSVSFILLSYFLLAMIWFASNRYDWDWAYNFNVQLTRKINNLRLVLQILFCHPPGAANDRHAAQPIRFFFTDQTRVSSTAGGENSVVQMIGSLYDAIENRYGSLATRLYRAFKPKAVKSASRWTWRKVCCLPYVIFFELTFLMILIGTCALTIYLIHVNVTKVDSDSDNVDEFKLKMILVIAALMLGVACLANMYTWSRMLKSLFFSQRRHVQRSIAKLETLKSEGFLQMLRQEVNLMKEMVKCLDSLSNQQTRLVVIVDGLDSCEQDKVLLVLDTVHMLFSDANTPFIVILAIDPHVIAKAVEVNTRRLFSENNIGGHNYLSNMVHLPFYLQNSGLRKVKIAQQTALAHKKQVGSWTENEENLNSFLARSSSSRRLSNEKALMSSTENLGKYPGRKGSRKLKMSESVASSIGSNLNRIGGAQDLTKMLLTDDYFSDVNPRSMRRLMNVVYVAGRLLKAFQIDFNWYRLASWINITEQWPFRTSWIIHHYDMYEDSLDDNTSLKSIYDKIRPNIPIVKDTEPLLELDRDEKKFDIFLSFHRSSLLVSDLKIFLPFTINLDPYLKKVIKEETQCLEDDGLRMVPIKSTNPAGQYTTWNSSTEWTTPRTNLSRRVRINPKATPITVINQQTTPQASMMAPQINPGLNWSDWTDPGSYRPPSLPMASLTITEPEILETRLSTLNVDGVVKLLSNISDLNPNALEDYIKTIKENNINGRVLLHCDLEELKKLLKMNFGDWEMFRVTLVILREQEMSYLLQPDETKPIRIVQKVERRNSNKSTTTNEKEKLPEERQRKQSIIEKQVTLEDQMICGALQTLNEEACEDVLEETEETKITIESDVPQTSIIPPSPDQNQVSERKISVNSMTKHSNLKSNENVSKGRHVIIKTDYSETAPRISISTTKASVSYETLVTNKTPLLQGHSNNMGSHAKQRPSSLNFNKNDGRRAKFKTRSKSIDNSPKGEKRDKINFDTLHRLKEKLLHSTPDLNDTSDNESTPLVSEVSTPSKSGHSSEIKTPSSRSYPLSPSSQKSLSPEKPKMTRSELNIGDADDSSIAQDISDGFTERKANQRSYYGERRRTMSDEISNSVSMHLMERSSSNLSVRSSQSSGRLSRQNALDSLENLTDIYCHPGSKDD
ncbi:kinase D-interacting substrate of 220 kDa B isoform X4 [Diorhabda carinulata]|uniref:kinase D-interacting substrate of 220 kDa B isoform X4 n=1 Tax=Diorhabda carinulata TaxID=1163345 RepID=UPI0025A0D65C|nr:kinase D-interacting substrate of 220 kDa B isoform X4 [Diorhabda carinulata]